jgi:hypothetical protein
MTVYRKEVTETYNLGNYEQIKVAASVEYEDTELPHDEAQDQLEGLMTVERQRAYNMTTTRNSFVNHHPMIEKDER